MKILILINQYPIQPRTVKVIDSMKKLIPQVEIKVLAWNRSNLVNYEEEIISVNCDCGYGNKIKKAFGMLYFFREAKKFIKDYNPDYIHAIDWDMLAIGCLLKRNEIIYEVYDIPNCNNKILEKIMISIERISLKKVNKVLVASQYFKQEYLDKEVHILNNKPKKYFYKNEIKLQEKRKDIVIGYVGKIRNYKILEMLIDECTNLNIKLLIAGDGPDAKKIRKYIEMKKNVEYLGKYEYSDINNIYSNIDIIWAAYPIDNRNVRYAISNRFYESSILGKPCIVTDKTELGKYVIENNLGYVVNTESRENIRNILRDIISNKDKLNEFKNNINKISNKMYWEEEEECIKEIYLR